MRAKEFIIESKRGKPEIDFYKANPGALGPKGRDNLYVSRYYDHYKLGMLLGMPEEDLEKLDAIGYMSNLPIFNTYVPAERDKIIRAFKKLGLKPHDYVQQGSKELDTTNKISPVSATKKNKYGI